MVSALLLRALSADIFYNTVPAIRHKAAIIDLRIVLLFKFY